MSAKLRTVGRVLFSGRWKEFFHQSQVAKNQQPAQILTFSNTSRPARNLPRATMAEPFDPYYTWLGIPPNEQPADHYRLLGIRRFEENREVISHAADQRMAHVRSFQTGPAAQHSQRVLNELSKAAGCLLNPRRKAMYDQHLQSSNVQAATAEAMRPPSPASVPAVQIQTRNQTRPPLRPKTKHRRTLIVAISATTVLIVFSVAAFVLNRQEPTPNGLPSNTDPVAIAPPDVASNVSPNTTPVPVTPATTKDPGATQPSVSPSTSPLVGSTGSPETPPLNPAVTTPPTATAPEVTSTASTIPALPNNPIPPTIAPPDESAAAAIPAGKPKALHFRGTDHVEIENSKGLIDLKTPFTIEMWVRFAADVSAHWLVGDLIIGPNHPEVSGGSVAGWQLFVQAGNAGAHRIGFSTREGYASDFRSASSWHHVSVGSDSRRLTIHVDGQRLAAGNPENLIKSYTASPIPIHIGGHGHLHASQSPGLTGDVREFRISSVCRYTANFEPSPKFVADSDTQVLWDLLSSSGNKVSDVSGHHRDGVIRGAQWIAVDEATAIAAVSPTMPASPGTLPSVSPMPVSPLPTASVPSTAVAAREPVPNEVALIKAREQIESVFEADIKLAKTPKELIGLADKLLALAADSNDDSAARYAMLDEAQKLAAQAGDLTKALSVISELGNRFEVDGSGLKAAAVTTSADVIKTTADRRKLSESCILLLEEIIAAGDLEAASEIVQVAVAGATRAKDTELGKIARDYRDDISHIKKRLAAAREIEAKLEASPNDPELNLEWGRLVCFVQRDWNKGLPALSKGSDAQLAAIAKQDSEKPTDSDKQVALGQAWASLIKQVEVSERPAVTARALHWLRQAEPHLKGLAKAGVENQIKELGTTLPPRFQLAALGPAQSNAPAFQPPPEFVGIIGRIQVNGIDAGIMWKYESGLRMNQTNILSVLAQANVPRGKLRFEFVGFVYAPESLTVNIAQQGGSATGTANLIVDNKPIGEVGGMRATSDVYKLELNAGEHTVRWILQGDDLGASSLNFTNSTTAQPLTLYHTQPLLTVVSGTPSRARLNVNMSRN